MKKWAVIVCIALGAWLIVFAVFNRRQTPSEDSPYNHPALSKETRAILDTSESFVLVSIDRTPPFPENQIDSLTNLFSVEKNESPPDKYGAETKHARAFPQLSPTRTNRDQKPEAKKPITERFVSRSQKIWWRSCLLRAAPRNHCRKGHEHR